jgi:broad specificity phosphatase PhoE
MKNKYYLIRHGQSTSNINGIICSTLENGIKPNFALTKTGQIQVQRSANELKKIIVGDSLIFTSPFSRTLQTALIIKDTLELNNTSFFISMGLVERNFGKYELGSSKNYDKIWSNDVTAKDTKTVESTNLVATRVNQFIMSMESSYSNKNIIVVSHGDTLMIMRTIFLAVNSYTHRSFPYINNAEILIF